MTAKFPDGDFVELWRGCDHPPATGRNEFVIAPGGNIDSRCTCRLIGFLPADDSEDAIGDEGAWFAWTEGCPVHREAPFAKFGERVKTLPSENR